MASIKNFIKFNKGAWWLYRRIGSAVFSFIGALTPTNPRRVLFMSYGGRQFSDSPRALYEAMRDDPWFEDWEMAWGFVDPTEHEGIGCRAIRVDTPEYFKYALSSRVWVTNTTVCRGLQFKGKNTINVNTWHGTPLKRIGQDQDPNPRYKERVDIGCCQNDMDRKVLLRQFNIDPRNLLPVDLPRNDSLLRYTTADVAAIKERLGIPEGKRVLLYMPTWRDYDVSGGYGTYLIPPIDLKRWERELGDRYVLLVRFHHLIEKAMDIPEGGFCINATGYEELNDLYAIADVLISDYSSCYVDYSILERPMLCFAYDFDEYSAFRGFEIDFESVMPCRLDRTEDDLIESINNMDEKEARKKAAVFHQTFSPHAGHATETMLDELKARLGKS